MKKFLLDSNVIIDHLKGRSKPAYKLSRLSKIGTVHVSTLSIAEIWAGLSSKERKATNYALKEIKRIPLTDKIARSAGILFYNKKKRGTTTSILDLIIATTAIENNLILISHDKIFRKIKSLKLHTPNKQ